MESPEARRAGGAIRSQIPAVVGAISDALQDLPFPQRRHLADQLKRDLEHLKSVCEEVPTILDGLKFNGSAGSNDQGSANNRILEKALYNLGYVSDHLYEYYDKYMRRLGPTAQRMAFRPSTGRGAFTERQMRARTDKETVAFVDDLSKIAEHVSRELDSIASGIAGDQATHVASLTFALGKLILLAEDLNQVYDRVHAKLYNEEDSSANRSWMNWMNPLNWGRKPNSKRNGS
jgi:hypothetical protein